ncbi:hypothetical protein Aperf_G00000035884 [Anoplocephala perfoliata]
MSYAPKLTSSNVEPEKKVSLHTHHSACMDYLCIILCLICFVQAEPESIIPSTGPGGALYLSFAFAVSGALAGGYDCNEYESCELLFKICVNSENSGDCDLFNVTTSPVRNVASVAYEGSSAFRFSFRPPTNKIRVVIEPCDYDFKYNAVPIGRFYSIVLIENITSKDTPLKLRPAKSLFVNEFKIKASMRKECNPGFFGHICQYHIHKSSSNSSVYCPHSGHSAVRDIHAALCLRT